MYKVHQFEKSVTMFAKEKKWKGTINIKKFGIKLSEVRRTKRIKKWREQNGRCYYCRTHLSQSETTYDHIIPQSVGGSEHYDNFVVACKKCNSARGVIDFGIFCNLVTCEDDREGFLNEIRAVKSRKIEKQKKENEVKNFKIIQIMSNFKPISKKYKKCKKLIGITTSKIHGIKNSKKIKTTDKNRMLAIYNKRLVVLKKIKNKWTTALHDNNKLLKIESKNRNINE
ncbi:MAG: HNH endonuclease [Caudoviricetes sp.]|nr:MAG: HNH endonuclease [Caudoviricetes sp.]